MNDANDRECPLMTQSGHRSSCIGAMRYRSRWADYEVAIEDMLEKTSPKGTPWYLIPANDKPYGRIAVFTILIDVLGKGLRLKPRPLDSKVANMAKQIFDLP